LYNVFEARLPDFGPEHSLGHRRTADVAQTNEQNALFHREPPSQTPDTQFQTSGLKPAPSGGRERTNADRPAAFRGARHGAPAPPDIERPQRPGPKCSWKDNVQAPVAAKNQNSSPRAKTACTTRPV